MQNLHILKESQNTPEAQSVIEDVFKLRYETFIKRLEWSINSENGLERDQFDALDPHHIALKGDDGEVKGCWRALPTTSEYMLPSVFPQILQGEQAPVDDSVWEISRFAVRKGTAQATRGYMNSITLQMVQSFWEFAQENNIKSYVTVTSVACERMLRQLGVTLRRMGDGKSMQVGEERSVALWIEVDANLQIATH